MSLLLLNETTPTLHDLPRKKTKQKFHSFLLRCKTCKKAVVFSRGKKVAKKFVPLQLFLSLSLDDQHIYCWKPITREI
jgi:hypothetical protein